jgi:prepilin-type N-terminal cleavage/methylation domain-containing protein
VTIVNVRRRLADESGLTLSEMLVVLVILGVVLSSLTGLFVSAMRTEVDQAKRFQAQQEARLALDSLRREIHCANTVSSDGATSWTSPAKTSIKINLGSYCSSAPPGGGDVTWCTQGVSAGRYALRRVVPALGVGAPCAGGVEKADYLTTDGVFTKLDTTGQKSKLGISIPVDVDLAATGGLYQLQDDIVLRNT